jgi:hypothetical protein
MNLSAKLQKMMRSPLLTLLFLLLSWNIQAQSQKRLPLDFDQGYSIYENGYVDQPYVVILNDETWLCTFTTSSKQEGSTGQHIMSLKSIDQGKTWTNPVAIEPADGPAASWVMPYKTPYGRVYAFYTYNGDKVTTLNDKPIRNDMLGWYCFKYTDDGGLSWSERYRIPMRKTNADLNNDWHGKVQIFWGIGKPIEHGKYMTLAFTKLGKYMLDMGEGWFIQSDNIRTEKNPEKINWKLLPEGMNGVRNPDFGSVQEEFNLVHIAGDTLYTVYRTDHGFIAESKSFDNGHSWSMPDSARYTDGKVLQNPRACPRIWKTGDNEYLIWFHNHGGTGFANRNPGWVAKGKWEQGKMCWEKPIALIYREDQSYERGRLSYPDLIQQNNKIWITLTNKEHGRILQIK